MDCMRNQFVEGVLLNGRYETISPLNNGSFGMVFMARDVVTDDIVALKCLTKSSAATVCHPDLAIDDRSEELEIHRRIGQHPHLVSLMDTFETDSHSYLVQEFCSNGDLYEAIRLGKGPLETEHVRDFMFQLVDAVEHMHSKGIYHRDIKPENILLTQTGSVKLGDFGLATTDDVSFEIAVGSDRYMAPEQLDPPMAGYSPANADIWAIGICLLNILFARNPFATPTTLDPLFADFAGDRQTLFDVFPNMSQDTFEILRHCLALDPCNRSLSAAKEALARVITFTIDDESLDEFCVVDNDFVTATANREPLRTPSVSTQVDSNGAFPWAKALALSPHQPVRQLSAIADNEPFVERKTNGSSRDWFDVKQEAGSVASFVDSGLGVSIDSQAAEFQPIEVTRSRPVPIAGSVPTHIARPTPTMSIAFGAKRDTVSKSWSDLWDEEEEQHENAHGSENAFVGFKQRLLNEERSQVSSGNTTPRAGLSEVKNPAQVNNSRDRNPETAAAVRRVDEHVSEQTGFIFEDHHGNGKYSPPSKRSLMEKWAALGDRRRARQTPEKPSASRGGNIITNTHSTWTGYGRKRSRAGSWRRNTGTAGIYEHHGGNGSGVFDRKDWSLSKDWRRHGAAEQHQQQQEHSSSTVVVDDIGDLEWVGGWHDLHL